MHIASAPTLLKAVLHFWGKPKDAAIVTLLTLVYIAVCDNGTLWQQIWQRNPDQALQNAYIILSLIATLVMLLLLAVSALSHHRILKPVLSVLLFLGACVGFYNNIGVIFDETMIENIILSDVREARELMSITYLNHLAVFFLIPSIILWLTPIKKETLTRFLLTRSALSMASVVIAVVIVFSDFQSLSFFIRENNDLKVYVNPVYPMISARRYVKSKTKEQVPFVVLGNDAQQIKSQQRRTVGVFIVGETARSDHFSLNDYARITNPYLREQDVVSYNYAEACGTSTAYSLPCMFSFIGADAYKPADARNQSNVLDVLEQAGIKTLWRDNNSTCKGVCARIESENFRTDPDPNSEFFHIDQYYDEILLSELNEKISSTEKDLLIVLHPLGSHGPSYHRRYPDRFEKFTPACKSDAPQTCTQEEVVNAYDNTILYTDYIVSNVIDLLKKHTTELNSFVVYAADHGESLGENGIYLHGIPKIFAPKEQTHIPFIVWLSENEKQKLKLTSDQLRACDQQAISHDNISHSLLSLFDVQTSMYQPQLSLFSGDCNTRDIAYVQK